MTPATATRATEACGHRPPPGPALVGAGSIETALLAGDVTLH
jgi:hypothetical protein